MLNWLFGMRKVSVGEEAEVVDFEDSEKLAQDLAPTEVPIAKTLDDVFRSKIIALSFELLSM